MRLLQREVTKLKDESYLVNGFPRTKVQALSFSKIQVLPDKLINLNINKDVVLNRLNEQCRAIDFDMFGSELESLKERLYTEIERNQQGVNSSFSQFVF